MQPLLDPIPGRLGCKDEPGKRNGGNGSQRTQHQELRNLPESGHFLRGHRERRKVAHQRAVDQRACRTGHDDRSEHPNGVCTQHNFQREERAGDRRVEQCGYARRSRATQQGARMARAEAQEHRDRAGKRRTQVNHRALPPRTGTTTQGNDRDHGAHQAILDPYPTTIQVAGTDHIRDPECAVSREAELDQQTDRQPGAGWNHEEQPPGRHGKKRNRGVIHAIGQGLNEVDRLAKCDRGQSNHDPEQAGEKPYIRPTELVGSPPREMHRSKRAAAENPFAGYPDHSGHPPSECSLSADSPPQLPPAQALAPVQHRKNRALLSLQGPLPGGDATSSRDSPSRLAIR